MKIIRHTDKQIIEVDYVNGVIILNIDKENNDSLDYAEIQIKSGSSWFLEEILEKILKFSKEEIREILDNLE